MMMPSQSLSVRYAYLLFVAALGLTLAVAALPRLNQLEVFKGLEAIYPTVPIFNSLDSPYYVALAQAINTNTLTEYEQHRSYPDRLGLSSPAPSWHEYLKVPLLSRILAWASRALNADPYKIANHLIPVLAILFIIPLALYFFRVGLPVVGLMGGLITSYGLGYLVRTSIGRIDTDLLNLFFPLLASLILLSFHQSQKKRFLDPHSIMLGITFFFFMWWNPKSVFLLLYVPIFILFLCLKKMSWRAGLVNLVVVVLLTGPHYFMQVSSDLHYILGFYFRAAFPSWQAAQSAASTGTIVFPNVAETITEVGLTNPNELMVTQVNHVFWGWLGLALFVWWALRNWRLALPLLPLFLIGIASIKLGKRFSIYLIPFLGIGLGIGLTRLTTLIPQLRNYFAKSAKGELIGQLVRYTIGIVLALAVIPSRAHSYMPNLSVPAEVVQAYELILKHTPQDSVILNWWDPGYILLERTGRYVFHDGGTQGTPRTYLIARALTSSSPMELSQTIQFIATQGLAGIEKNQGSLDQLKQAIQQNTTQPSHSIYAFLAWDTVPIMTTLHYLGRWDFEKKASRHNGFGPLQCRTKRGAVLDCQGRTINLETGDMNGRKLKRAVWVNQGRVTTEKTYQGTTALTVEILEIEERAGNKSLLVLLMDESIYRTNFNQMFVLGRFDPTLFEEVVIQYPVARLFRFKFAEIPEDVPAAMP